MSSERTPRATLGAPQEGLESSTNELPADDFLKIVSVLYSAVRHGSELQRFAEEARGNEELRAFFERCALTQTERALEAKQLLISQGLTHRAEVITSAAFAAGDGATDADVSPSSERRTVRVWPGQ